MTVEVLTTKRAHAIRVQERIDSGRYKWLRENPSFASTMELMKLTPDEFDTWVDKYRAQGVNNV